MKCRLLAIFLVTSMFLGGCGAKPASSTSAAGSAASGEDGSRSGGEKATLVVSNFALSDDKITEAILKPFEEEFNCEVIYDVGTNAERLTKVRNDPNTDVDVIHLSQQYAQQAVDEKLVIEMDYARLPNAADLVDSAGIFVDSKQGPPETMNRLAIIYDPAKVTISSFADIWKEEYRGQVAIPDITTTFGPAMVAIASAYAKTDLASDGGTAAFQALEALKPNVVTSYTKSSDLKNLFEAGEITIAVAAEFAYKALGDARDELVFLDPSEGPYLNFNTMNIVKNTDQMDLAYEYVNYVLSPEIQLRYAEIVVAATINKTVALPPEIAELVTTVEIANSANTMDFGLVNLKLSEWIDQWNRTMNQ